jgi:hypothetical protein
MSGMTEASTTKPLNAPYAEPYVDDGDGIQLGPTRQVPRRPADLAHARARCKGAPCLERPALCGSNSEFAS